MPLIGRDNINKVYKHNSVEPGDDLREGDLVLVATTYTDGDTTSDRVRFGTFHGPSPECEEGEISYFSNRLQYKHIKEEFKYTFYNKVSKITFTHYILKVYRHSPDSSNVLVPKDDKDILKGKIENSRDYHCAYKDTRLLKRFNIE